MINWPPMMMNYSTASTSYHQFTVGRQWLLFFLRLFDFFFLVRILKEEIYPFLCILWVIYWACTLLCVPATIVLFFLKVYLGIMHLYNYIVISSLWTSSSTSEYWICMFQIVSWFDVVFWLSHQQEYRKLEIKLTLTSSWRTVHRDEIDRKKKYLEEICLMHRNKYNWTLKKFRLIHWNNELVKWHFRACCQLELANGGRNWWVLKAVCS